jgi:hypothetical protein
MSGTSASAAGLGHEGILRDIPLSLCLSNHLYLLIKPSNRAHSNLIDALADPKYATMVSEHLPLELP